jgi:hypothetical protein
VNPKPGDIGLVRIRGEAGRLIRIGQWLNGDGYADYEHAYVLVDNHHIVEAQPGGAVCVPQRHSWTETRWLSCPPEHARFVARAAMGMVGTPYSALDYFAIAAHRLRIPSQALDRYVSNSHHMICSQLADEAAMRGGWHLFSDGRIPQDVTPGDLWKLAEHQ